MISNEFSTTPRVFKAKKFRKKYFTKNLKLYSIAYTLENHLQVCKKRCVQTNFLKYNMNNNKPKHTHLNIL